MKQIRLANLLSMARTCTVCKSRRRAEIESALVTGVSLRDIARRFKTTKDSLQRHKDNCVQKALAKRTKDRELALADRLLEEMEELHGATRALLQRATDDKDFRTALRAVGEARRNLTVVARMVGRLDPKQDQDRKDGQMWTWEEFLVIHGRRGQAK